MNKVKFWDPIVFAAVEIYNVSFVSETVVTLGLGVKTSLSLGKKNLGLGMFSWM